jgi:hypothetical protein
MTHDFRPTNSTEAKNQTMTTKSEKQKALSTVPKAQQDRIKAVAEKQSARADGPPMNGPCSDKLSSLQDKSSTRAYPHCRSKKGGQHDSNGGYLGG